MQQALDRLKKATEDMQNAENQQNGSPEQTAAGQRRAADRLQEARDILNGMQHQNASQQLDDLAQQANQLAQQQTDFQNRLRQDGRRSGSARIRASARRGSRISSRPSVWPAKRRRWPTS